VTAHKGFRKYNILFSSCIKYTLSEGSKTPLQSLEIFSGINQSTFQMEHKIGNAGMYSGW
jgi:hypothetical protein